MHAHNSLSCTHNCCQGYCQNDPVTLKNDIIL